MDRFQKLARLKILIGVANNDEDEVLDALLEMSRDAILAWIYGMRGGVPNNVIDVPHEYEPTQIMAVIVGYGLIGAEGQISHSENGVSRQFNYSDMLAYIRKNVIAYAGGAIRENT